MTDFADAFTDADAADMIDALGERCTLTVDGQDPVAIKAVPAEDDWRESGDEHEFVNFRLEMDIHSSALPEGVTRAGLIRQATLQRDERDERAQHVMDARDTGQGVLRLVLEP